MPFTKLGLYSSIVRAVAAKGYGEPTPIQQQSIPVVLSGRDLIASAQTGTGKTAAFALPILNRLGPHKLPAPRVLVLEPTRELAAQVDEAFREFGQFTDLRTALVHGGVGYGAQRNALHKGSDIVVATVGRLMDFLQERALRLDHLQVLVLDEVDRMLDMGFINDVKTIVSLCPKKRQTLFFSATVPPEIEAVARFALTDPVRISIGRTRSVNESVTHAIYPVSQGLKFALLLALLEKTNFNSVLIFTRTKHGADKIALRLKEAGHSVAILHGNRSQGQRTAALKGFKNGEYEVMVATDIAARGIDVAGVSHVINYDIPMTPDDYVHRIGRTGRAAAVGDAFTLATPQEADEVRRIERFIKATIPQLKLEGFDYKAAPPPGVIGAGDFRGGRRQGQGHGRARNGAHQSPAAHHPKGKPGGHWRRGGRH
jgi:ATP-dependent RNA helicase RhlE